MRSLDEMVEVFRLLDRALGWLVIRPLAALLLLARRIGLGPRPSREVRKVLIIKFFGMGSLTLASSALRSIRLNHPDARILLLTFESNRAFARHMGIFDEILTAQNKGGAALFAFAALQLVRIVFLRVDLAINCEFFSNVATLTTLATRAPVRIGFAEPGSSQAACYTRIVEFDDRVHIRILFRRLVLQAGCELGIDKLVPPHVSESARYSLTRKLEGLGIEESDGVRLVVVNVNASRVALVRRWHPDRFALLIDALVGRWPTARFLFTGTLEEKTYVQGVLDLLGDPARVSSRNLAGLLEIGELLALIESSAIVVTCDSGPLHLAVALGRRTVSFFGPEAPTLYGPQGPLHRTLYSADRPCSPCMDITRGKLTRCQSNRCMDDIDVETALRAATALAPEMEGEGPTVDRMLLGA